jgi:selenide,water dikinase
MDDPSLLAGSAGFEDAGVFRLDSERALVQSTDFFPPVVDDPRWYGRIAAANALSDIYAMGGRALTALNIVGWPLELDAEILGEIMAGGMDRIRDAGAVLCGGHSVSDSEIKYGLAVTGEVHPDKFWRNSSAEAGDLLLLSKPVGMGATATAIKRQKIVADIALKAMEQMGSLNKLASDALADSGVHAATDVTGFGLLGHALEMVRGADLLLEIKAAAVPLFEGAYALVEDGLASGASGRNRAALGKYIEVESDVDDTLAALLFDAETSGGLLFALPESMAEQAVNRLRDHGTHSYAVIGEFTGSREAGIRLAP